MSRLVIIIIATTFMISSAYAQNIGIGTSSPDYNLDVNGTVGVNDYIYHNNDSDTWMAFPNIDEWEVVAGNRKMLLADGLANSLIVNPTGSNSSFLILADGVDHLIDVNPSTRLIGIGTPNPSYLFDVNGDFRVMGDAVDHLFYVSTSTNRVGVGTSTPSYEFDVSGSLRVMGDQVDHLFFVDAANDRIGIGVSNPTCKMDINGRVGVQELQIAGNYLPFLEKMQTGVDSAFFNTGGNSSQIFTIPFSNAFSEKPNVIGTVYNTTPAVDTIDTGVYVSSIIEITNSDVKFNVRHVGSGNPDTWLKLSWMAWIE